MANHEDVRTTRADGKTWRRCLFCWKGVLRLDQTRPMIKHVPVLRRGMRPHAEVYGTTCKGSYRETAEFPAGYPWGTHINELLGDPEKR